MRYGVNYLVTVCIFCLLSLAIGCDNYAVLPVGSLEFSHEEGTYFQPMEVSIRSDNAHAIHYTTDGTTPTEQSTRYFRPIRIDASTRLRVVALDGNGKRVRTARVDYVLPRALPGSPYLVIPEKRIYHVSDTYEYSLDGGVHWSPCEDTVQNVQELRVGDSVWVRHRLVTGDLHYLGTVDALTGFDLVAGPTYVGKIAAGGAMFSEEIVLVFDNDLADDGEITFAVPTIHNRGDTQFTGRIQIDLYASADPLVDEDDIHFHSIETKEITLDPGETFGVQTSDLFPDLNTIKEQIKEASLVSLSGEELLPGEYYIGFHIVVLEKPDGIDELSTHNNWTLPQHTDVVRIISDFSEISSEGAFKIANSHGVGTWENVDDGYYWLPFETIIELKPQVYYYLNDICSSYDPTVVARFKVEHPDRNACLVSVGVGNHENPIAEKLLQNIVGVGSGYTVTSGGSQPFPDNHIVLDISEFAPYLATHPVYLRVNNRSEDEVAVITHFSLELHIDRYQESSPVDESATIRAEISAEAPFTVESEQSGHVELIPKDHWDSFQFTAALPNVRNSTKEDSPFEFTSLTESEIASIIRSYDTQKQVDDRTRATATRTQFGGGLLPPTEEELRSLSTIRSIGTSYGGPLPDMVDLSATAYFPPIGNQGAKGSCASFSTVYYIHTYNMARKYGWDLSQATWNDSEYAPDQDYWSKIMSPDFVYHHMVVPGGEGSNIAATISFLDRIGGATWSTMPTEMENDVALDFSYRWPTEEAYREAARYRGRAPGANLFRDNARGLIVVDSMEKVRVVQQLLASGYCLSTAVDAQVVYDQWMDKHDVAVFDEDDMGDYMIDHAQTIVGYRSGDLWNSSDPGN